MTRNREQDREYMRRYRKTEQRRVYELIRHRARRRALADLARENPVRYRELFEAHLSDSDLHPDTPEWQYARRAILQRLGRPA